RSIIGRVLTLNGESYTVIGVARAGFAFPRGSEMPGDFQFAAMPELWVPLKPPSEGIADLAIVGRLRAGTTHFAARQDMERGMAEVVLLVAAGGAAGIALGSAGIELLRTYGAAQLPRAAELAFDARFAAAALGIMVIAAIAVSILPLLFGGGADLMTTLRSGGS